MMTFISELIGTQPILAIFLAIGLGYAVGQINILRRLAGAPVKGESYYEAAIETGRVGADQAKPKREF